MALTRRCQKVWGSPEKKSHGTTEYPVSAVKSNHQIFLSKFGSFVNEVQMPREVAMAMLVPSRIGLLNSEMRSPIHNEDAHIHMIFGHDRHNTVLWIS